MFDTPQLDRRQLFGTGAGLLAFTALPAYARRGRFNNLGWNKVQAMLDAYVADDRLPGAVGAVARGTDDASFLFSGKIARGETRVTFITAAKAAQATAAANLVNKAAANDAGLTPRSTWSLSLDGSPSKSSRGFTNQCNLPGALASGT